MRRIATTAAMLLVSVVLCGCGGSSSDQARTARPAGVLSSSTTTAKAPWCRKMLSPTDSFETKGLRIQIGDINHPVYGHAGDPNSNTVAPDNRMYLAVHVTITNITDEAGDPNWLVFSSSASSEHTKGFWGFSDSGSDVVRWGAPSGFYLPELDGHTDLIFGEGQAAVGVGDGRLKAHESLSGYMVFDIEPSNFVGFAVMADENQDHGDACWPVKIPDGGTTS